MEKKLRWLYILLAMVMALLVAMFVSSCEVLKHKRSISSDSTSLKKVVEVAKDSAAGGSVSKENSKTKEEFDWWRMIQQFPRDTTIINNNSYPQPATIIYEGGRGSKEEEVQKSDSSYFLSVEERIIEKLDSMSSRIDTIDKNKKSETKGVGLLALILVVGGGVVLLKVMGWIGNNYSITKKK